MSANIVFGRAAVTARLLAGVSLAALATIPVAAADISFKGTGAFPNWSAGGSWVGAVAPGAGDRAIFGTGSTATKVGMPSGTSSTMGLGSIWIQSGSLLTTFDNASAQQVLLQGTDGVAAQTDKAASVVFLRRSLLANDLSFRATHADGGGFIWSGTVLNGVWQGLDLNGHTATFDTVNAANTMSFVGSSNISGAGNVVKTGAGSLSIASVSTYTGYTDVRSGRLVLTGGGSIASSSGLHNDGVFDISATNGPGASIRTLSGAGVVELGARTLRLTNAADTFAGVIEGSGGLSIDAGTAILAGANTYGGLTRVWSGATLRLGDGGAGGSVAGAIATDGTLVFDRSDDAVHAGVISGAGRIDHVGSGKTTLTAHNTAFQGFTTVYAGILSVDGTLDGMMDVRGGRLQGTGTVGWTHNYAGGTIAPGNSIGVLTVDGDYTSDGGVLEIEAILGDDSSSADLLLISGNALLGLAPTLVNVVNLGGLGGETTGDGIKIVEVQGGVSDAGAFVLGAPAIGGAYSYKLVQNGLSDPADGDWYLRADKLAPTTPTFENYPVALLGMIDLPTLRQRVGERSEAADGIWTRIEGAAGHH